jgi:hypothetical protein
MTETGTWLDYNSLSIIIVTTNMSITVFKCDVDVCIVSIQINENCINQKSLSW